MKVAQIYSYGNSDKIKIENAPRPRAEKNQVLVKIHDAGVNPVDWKIREGFMSPAHPTFPMTLGHDFAGEVIELGPNVTDFQAGDRIFGFTHGSYAEFAVADVERIALVPDDMDLATAAAIPTPGLTAWQAMTDVAHVRSGQKVLIHGAGGSVGSIAAQIAIWKDARVYAVASSEDRAFLEKLGVEKVIDYKTQHFEELVKDIDLVLDLVGGDTMKRSFEVMKKDAIAISTVGSFKEAEAQSYRVRGVNFVMNQNATDLAEIAELADKKIIQVRVGEILPLAEARHAQDLSQKGHVHGKVVIQVV